jgi:hypothetical protein
MGVAQIVEADARQGLMLREQQMPLVGDGSRLQRGAIGLGDDKVVVC